MQRGGHKRMPIWQSLPPIVGFRYICSLIKALADKKRIGRVRIRGIEPLYPTYKFYAFKSVHLFLNGGNRN